MFDWFKKKETQPDSPEILGLRLGGAVEFDPLKFKLNEPDLIIEGAASTQIIQAVGKVMLDENTRLIRFYTDDDGFIQVLIHGDNEQDISEVKLFYFYDTKPIDTDSQWQQLLDNGIVKPNWQLEQYSFDKLWDNQLPVAVTEKTWHMNGKITETDQFIMLYEREASPQLNEVLLVAGEEKIVNQQAERCLVLSTGFDLGSTDIRFTG